MLIFISLATLVQLTTAQNTSITSTTVSLTLYAFDPRNSWLVPQGVVSRTTSPLPLPLSQTRDQYNAFLEACHTFRLSLVPNTTSFAKPVTSIPSPNTVLAQLPDEWLRSSNSTLASNAQKYTQLFGAGNSSNETVRNFWNDLCPEIPTWMKDAAFLDRLNTVQTNCFRVNETSASLVPPRTLFPSMQGFNGSLKTKTLLHRRVLGAIANISGTDYFERIMTFTNRSNRIDYNKELWNRLLTNSTWSTDEVSTFWKSFCDVRLGRQNRDIIGNVTRRRRGQNSTGSTTSLSSTRRSFKSIVSLHNACILLFAVTFAIYA